MKRIVMLFATIFAQLLLTSAASAGPRDRVIGQTFYALLCDRADYLFPQRRDCIFQLEFGYDNSIRGSRQGSFSETREGKLYIFGGEQNEALVDVKKAPKEIVYDDHRGNSYTMVNVADKPLPVPVLPPTITFKAMQIKTPLNYLDGNKRENYKWFADRVKAYKDAGKLVSFAEEVTSGVAIISIEFKSLVDIKKFALEILKNSPDLQFSETYVSVKKDICGDSLAK